MRTHAMGRAAARYRWDRLKVSFWFAPAVMALLAVLLAWAMYWLDNRIPNAALANNRFFLSGSVAELRTTLITIATTTLATAGVVFTLLTLPLSTVAAQYGSRLLRVFLGDRTTQLVLGMFVATFVYGIAGALSIASTAVEPAGPQLTATVGLYLMMATFASLIVLVQHVSTMLQAPNIAAAAGAELVEVVQAEITEEVTSGDVRASLIGHTGQGAPGTQMEPEGFLVRLTRTGYLQYVDPETLLTLAREKDLVIRLLRKPGHFVGGSVAVAQVWPAGRVDAQLAGQIRQVFQIGNVRTPTQDVEYAVNQLVEMAVRAMSPAINDPFTAMTCLDHIGEGLALFIRQGEKGSHYYDRAGRLRLVLEPVTFDQLFGAAFDMLRHASCDNSSVLQRMLQVIEMIGRETQAPEARRQLLRHVCLIQAESQAGDLIEQDRQAIQLCNQALQTELEAPWSARSTEKGDL
jgi:uncharacterized membrane protein